MNVQELLAKSEFQLTNNDSQVLHLEGAVSRDSDEAKIRVYPDPRNSSLYVLIDGSDVVGSIVELHEDYKNTLGLSGFRLFRLSVKRGTSVQTVTISHHKLGETLIMPSLKNALSWSPGDCRNASDCSDGCCTYDSIGCRCDRCCLG